MQFFPTSPNETLNTTLMLELNARCQLWTCDGGSSGGGWMRSFFGGIMILSFLTLPLSLYSTIGF